MLEQLKALDEPGKAVAKKVRELLGGGRLKEAVSGTGLGHPAHPPLTDVVIGSFMSASLLDLIAPQAGATSARLIALGIAASAPTALTGVSDWADTELSDDGVRRVGMVHAAANVSALLTYAASLLARRRGARARGALLALTGASLLTAGGYLGGHMAYVRGVGVNQTVFDPGPQEWTPVLNSSELQDGKLHSVHAEGTPVMLVRQNNTTYAIHDRCSHRGCLLSDGDLDGTTVTCGCHGSQFDVRDGTLLRGPATTSQPTMEVREADGRVEVRRVTLD